MAYTPASNVTTTSTLAHLQSVYYKKTGLDRLVKTFKFREPCMEDDVPKMSGKTVQWFRYKNFSTNTTASTEGSVGTGLSLTSNIVTATVSEYSNFVSVSTFLKETGIDSTLDAASDLLGYQAGLSVDTITRNVFDNESSSTNLNPIGTYLRVSDLRNAATQLSALDVQPMEDGLFYAIIHPYINYDVVNDPAAGGLADIYKFTDPSKAALVESTGEQVFTAGDCRVVKSTNVTKIAGSPNKWRTYIFGKNGVGAVSLAGSGPSKITDPKKQRFSIMIQRFNGPTPSDPEGMIAGTAAYRYVYTAVVLDGPSGIGGSYRFKTIDAASSIAA